MQQCIPYTAFVVAPAPLKIRRFAANHRFDSEPIISGLLLYFPRIHFVVCSSLLHYVYTCTYRWQYTHFHCRIINSSCLTVESVDEISNADIDFLYANDAKFQLINSPKQSTVSISPSFIERPKQNKKITSKNPVIHNLWEIVLFSCSGYSLSVCRRP